MKAMIPSPPSWMSSSRKAWPHPVKYVAVSTTMRPVTHTALVAVNSASISERLGPVYNPGSVISPSVPSAMSSRNEPTNT